MKTKLFMVLGLFIGVLITSASAQGKSNKAVQGWTTGTYWSPIYCDGEMVDLLEGGVLRIHYVYRWEPGVFYKEVDQLKGEVTSAKTGEIFKIRETDHISASPGFYTVTWHYNLIGNMGTHYIGTLIQDMRTGEITIGHTVCH